MNNELSAEEMAVIYAVAGNVIPSHAFTNCRQFVSDILHAPTYMIVEMMTQASLTIGVGIPDIENKLHIEKGQKYLSQFIPVHGNLKEDTDYIVFPFPSPPLPKILHGRPVGSVFFAGIVYSTSNYIARCYFMRRSTAPNNPNPTTLREITIDGHNLNLGGGCNPFINDFIELL